MTMKVPNKLKTIEAKDVAHVNQNFEQAFATRVESIHHTTNSGSTPYLFQSIETGQVTYSATGSPTVTKSFGFKEKKGSVLFAQAHAKHAQFTAHVVDVTSTGITIDVVARPINPQVSVQTFISATGITVTATGTLLVSATAVTFSSITTAAVTVWYSVIGAEGS